MSSLDSNLGGADAQFPLTRLTLLMRMQGTDAGARSEAEQVFWEAYWKPLYAYARRSRPSEDAKDLVQGFCAWVIETDLLARFDRKRGRLRSFLLMWFQGHLRDEEAKSSTLKRGGGREGEDVAKIEVRYPGATPEEAFDIAWARDVVSGAFRRWKAKLAKRRDDVWRLALVQLLEVDGYDGLPDQEIFAGRHGVKAHQVREFIRGSKRRLQEEVMKELRESCGTFLEAAEEAVHMLRLAERKTTRGTRPC